MATVSWRGGWASTGLTASRPLWRASRRAGRVPARVVFDHLAEPASSDGAFLAATHAGAERALSELQVILSEARLNETSVAWLTSGAVATGPEEGVAGLSRAPLWGLVRSARAEHPDRQLQLLDVDAPPAEAALLAKLLSTAAEPELALRHGAVLAPRLVRAAEQCLRASRAGWSRRGRC